MIFSLKKIAFSFGIEYEPRTRPIDIRLYVAEYRVVAGEQGARQITAPYKYSNCKRDHVLLFAFFNFGKK